MDIKWTFFSTIVNVRIEGDSLICEIPDFTTTAIKLNDIEKLEYKTVEDMKSIDLVKIYTRSGEVIKLPVDPEENSYAHDFMDMITKILRFLNNPD